MAILGLTESPGPGAYTPKPENVKEKAASFTMRAKHDLAPHTTPGPGAYNNHLKLEAAKFEKSPQYTLRSKTNMTTVIAKTPGPGSYKAKVVMGDAPTHVLAAKLDRPDPTSLKTPGPGTYDATHPDKIQTKAPKYTLRAKNDIDHGLSNPSPGPGTYKHISSVGMGAKPSPVQGMFVFKHKPDDSDRVKVPGPGTYNTIPKKTSGPKYTMRKITDKGESRGGHTPGPGTYTPKLGKSKFSKTMGARLANHNVSTPGPGAYRPRLKKGVSSSMGKEKRLAMDAIARAGTPGPGAYRTIKKSFSTGGISLHAKIKDQDRFKVPGSGTYNPHLKMKHRAPAYSMGSKLKPHENGATPGPGAYKAKKGNKRGITMGARLQAWKGGGPGPGAYGHAYGSIAAGLKKKAGKTMSGRFTGSSYIYANSSTIKSYTMKAVRPQTSA